ncbi:MAG: histidinol-phosphate transaminase [Gemmatimonas sp.]|nr:histidinol-phosphate transaminase [Gemmatimonas sp.]
MNPFPEPSVAFSRRSFVRALGLGGGAALTAPSWVSARGLESLAGGDDFAALDRQLQGSAIRLMSNENPNGPVPAAIRAMQASFHEAAWYPASTEGRVVTALSRANGLPEEQILLGSGSGEILKIAVQAFCSPSKHLVTALPTFETPAGTARALGFPVKEVPLDARQRIDLDGMLREVKGAGLVFLCNPNNPTGHVHGKDAIDRFLRAALAADPEVVILVDEAYHEFVDDPSYASALPWVATQPRVFVSRTFSKIYGLAGLRVGYAFGQPATLARMAPHRVSNGVGALAQVAAVAALADTQQMAREQQANREARAFTSSVFTDLGYEVIPSQTNFVFVNVRREAREFQAACRAEGLIVGRPFPPMNQWSRVSIGTMDEMRRAAPVFRKLLG